MKKRVAFIFLLCYLMLPFISVAQSGTNTLIQSGPMLGYAEMREALIWIQTTNEAEVYAVYTDISASRIGKSTNIVRTKKKETDFTLCDQSG